MNKDMKKIRQLAKKKGTPLLSVNFQGKAVSFVYGSKTYWYPSLVKGVRKELERLA